MNTKILDFLNGDGSLDIERINKLPFEEYMNVLGEFTTEQTEEYISKMPKIESNEPIKAIEVEYGFDDERSGVDIDDFLIKIKKKYAKITKTKNDEKKDYHH